jgi:2'-5' RNA ligase
MRLFVAAETPAELLPILRSAALDLRAILDADAVRWLPEDRWSLVLASLGEKNDDDLPKTLSAIDEALTGKRAFNLVAHGVKLFTPTVAIYEFFSPDGNSGEICADLGLTLGTYNPNRRFRPHVTLALLPKTGARLANIPEAGSIWRFSKITLFEESGEDEPVRALQTWNLIE